MALAGAGRFLVGVDKRAWHPGPTFMAALLRAPSPVPARRLALRGLRLPPFARAAARAATGCESVRDPGRHPLAIAAQMA